MQVYKDIHLLTSLDPDCNVYLIDGELLIDAGTGNYFGDMKKEIESLCDPRGIKTLVNTHCHFDHTGGDRKFRDWLKMSIAIHTADKSLVENGQTLAELFGQKARILTVDQSLREGSVISTKNFNFTVIHTPGHTPGSICLYDADKKILISGDTLFENAVGRTDLPGGNKEQLITSLHRISELDADFLFPGHGTPKVRGIDFLIKQMINFMSEKKTI